MSRPRKPNMIAVVSGHTDLRALIILTSRVGFSPAVYYYFDLADLGLVEQHHWAVGPAGRASAHTGPDRDTVYLSRLIIGAKRGQRSGTWSGDVTDLRRKNLRIFTPTRRKGLDTSPEYDRVSSPGNR